MSIRDIVTHLQRAGIGAMLPGYLPLSAIIPVGDALLAAPVTAVKVQCGPHSSNIIYDLRHRARENMLVGLGGVKHQWEVDEAITAGAQFVSSDQLQPCLINYCQDKDLLFLPMLTQANGASLPTVAGCELIGIKATGQACVDDLFSAVNLLPNKSIVIVGDITTEAIPLYKQAGAHIIFAGKTLFHSPDQTMADIITRARQLQNMWDKN